MVDPAIQFGTYNDGWSGVTRDVCGRRFPPSMSLTSIIRIIGQMAE